MRYLPILLAISFCAFAQEEVPQTGSSLYESRCSFCHANTEGANDRIPDEARLKTFTAEQVLTALQSGAMVGMAAGLTDEEMRAIATFVTGKALGGAATAQAGMCTGDAAFEPDLTTGWSGWGLNTTNTRYQPNPGLSAADVPNLKLKWAFGFPDDTRAVAQPSIVGGRVFVGSHGGRFYSLDLATGCTHWVYEVGDIARTGNVIARDESSGRWVVYFGDSAGYLHAVDVLTGQPVWKVELDDYPVARITGSPVLYNGRLYVGVSSGEELGSGAPGYECCRFRGSLVAIDAATGEIAWKTYTIPDPATVFKTVEGRQIWGPAGASIWSAPTIDTKRNRIYAVTGNSYTEVDVPTSDAIVAFDLDTGSMLWSKQVTPGDNWLPGCPRSPLCPADAGDDFDLAASPVLVNTGGRDLLLAGQKSSVLYALDPDTGEVVWQTRLGGGGGFMGGIMWGLATDQDTAYVGVADPTGAEANPGFYALRTSDGELLWSSRIGEGSGSPSQPTAATLIPGAVFSATFGGHLLAHNPSTGEIVWDFDAAREFETVNGVAAKGGAFDGAGPAVAEGMVVVTSGMGFAGGMPGNVLLAFSPDGE